MLSMFGTSKLLNNEQEDQRSVATDDAMILRLRSVRQLVSCKLFCK